MSPTLFMPSEWLSWYLMYPQNVIDTFASVAVRTVHATMYAMGDLKRTVKADEVYLNIKAYKRSMFWIEPL